MIEGNKRLKVISYILICISFLIIWSDWALLISSYKLKKDSAADCKDKNDLTLFGAGSLFGYVPLLSGVATLKRHDARRGLLLTTTISSCILAAYDVSEAMSITNGECDLLKPITAIFFVQAILSAVLIFVAAFGWFSIGLSRRQPLTSTQSEEGVTADGTNDSPPVYDRAIRDPDSVAVRIEHGTMRYVHRIRNYFKSSIFNQKLIIPGTNLERISMTISIFTIVIVILQVIQEVLRVTSTDQKCTVKPQNETELIWCNDEIEISCISGFGYYLTMPAFFILIFGVQFRVTRRGITVGGWYALTIACCAILTFITLTALAMIDFVSFIGMIWFNNYTEIFPKPSCVYILYCAEVLIIVQAVLAIGGAALALVNSYIIISNFVDRFSDNTSPSRQLHRENNAEDNAQTNEAFTLEEEESSSSLDPKLPSYSVALNTMIRHNSLPNLSNLNRYTALPNLSSNAFQRSSSINSLRHPGSPPLYRKDIY